MKTLRLMRIESLESRSLLAGDLLHNFILPEDADGNGAVDPLDVLVVINQINQGSERSVGSFYADRLARWVDVDADRSLTPLDALVVVNQLNANLVDADRGLGFRASRVDVERRIERIELAIASNVLPPNISIDRADEILATLRFGGRPELGDRVVDGQLHWNRDIVPSVTDRIEDRPDDPSTGSGPSFADRFIQSLSERLAAFGVTPQVIETISAEITAACDSGNPMHLSEIRDRLAELGVDVDSILPQPRVPDPHDPPDGPIMPTIVVTEPIAEAILARLNRAGVNEEVIETITIEIWDAIRVGTPLDLRHVRMRLEELGVNWDSLHPPGNPNPPGNPSGPGVPDRDPGDFIGRLIPLLTRLGVNRDVMMTIVRELRDAAADGTPMTLPQVIDRLRELGVSFGR